MIDAIGIVVPAHNEQALIGPCLDALERACLAVEGRVATFVVLVLDSCYDATLAAAEGRLRTPHCISQVQFANVGGARAHGMQRVLARLAHGRTLDRIWLATTDADSRVPRRWLADHLQAAHEGAHALAGTIRVDSWRGYSARQAAVFQRRYGATQPSCERGHPHVHGANLGVRADAYSEVGGFASISTGEDHALWSALRCAGKHTVSKRSVVVTTSSRLLGRAPNGFANYLAEHCRRVT